MPLYVFLIKVWLDKISFKILSLSKVIEEKPLGVGSTPLDQEGLKLLFVLATEQTLLPMFFKVGDKSLINS